jgi:hypothetical protein
LRSCLPQLIFGRKTVKDIQIQTDAKVKATLGDTNPMKTALVPWTSFRLEEGEIRPTANVTVTWKSRAVLLLSHGFTFFICKKCKGFTKWCLICLVNEHCKTIFCNLFFHSDEGAVQRTMGFQKLSGFSLCLCLTFKLN